jgi:hypothetical protein
MSLTSKKIESDNLSTKVLKGVSIALRKMAESAAAKNENLIIADENGQIKSVSAKSLLRKMNKSTS